MKITLKTQAGKTIEISASNEYCVISVDGKVTGEFTVKDFTKDEFKITEIQD